MILVKTNPWKITDNFSKDLYKSSITVLQFSSVTAMWNSPKKFEWSEDVLAKPAFDRFLWLELFNTTYKIRRHS